MVIRLGAGSAALSNANTAVFLEGDVGDSAFVIAEGEVKVLRNVKGGRARRLVAGP